jgi:hypothetical protein
VKDPIRKVTLRDGTVRYRFVVDVPPGPDGKRRQVTHTFQTKKEAQTELSKIRVESSTGQYVRPDKLKLAEYSTNGLPRRAEVWSREPYAATRTPYGYPMNFSATANSSPSPRMTLRAWSSTCLLSAGRRAGEWVPHSAHGQCR